MRLRDGLPLPAPAPGEALVRVRLAGICGTDLQLLRGYHPFTGVPGHEFVGEVTAAPGDEAWEGRRVVGEINVACGTCRHCRAGRRGHCERRTVLGIRDRDGAFADFVTLPVANLHAVPDGVPDEAAVFAEPLAAALRIPEQVRIAPEQRILVIGGGRLGQLVARVLAGTGAGVDVTARYTAQRRLLEADGITVLDESQPDAAGYDVVVDTAGAPGGFAAALRAVRPRGTLVMKSTYREAPTVDLAALVVNEITLVGSRCGPFAPALDLLAQGRIDPTVLIQARYDFGEAEHAFATAAARGALKVLLQP